MILRDYQRRFVDECASALYQHRSALGVAPTGAGKTVMLSALIAEHGGRALVVQHREELLTQNRATFCLYTDTDPLDHGEVSAGVARWRHVTFAMVMSLRNRLDAMPPVDLLVIDEAHRARAESYRLLVERALEINPRALVFGVTATPDRGDRKGLGRVFKSVGSVIHVEDLIDAGHLVRPDARVIGEVDWTDAPRTSTGEYDLSSIEAEVTVEVVMDEVLRHWTREAGCRQSVFFCPGVASAHAYAERLQMLGVTAACVDGTTPSDERRRIFAGLRDGSIQVLTNVYVATEGWDCPPVSCVVLLRPSSYKSTMVQMVGRGLRASTGKTDCIVLDFGRSLQMHGDLTVIPRMRDPVPGEAPTKPCPECGATIPAAVATCPICGHDLQAEADAQERERVRLREIQMREFRLVEERRQRRIREAQPVWLEVSDRAMAACVSPGCGLILSRWRDQLWLVEADRSGPARIGAEWADDADMTEVMQSITERLVERCDAGELDESFLWRMREWSDRGAAASSPMRDQVQRLFRSRGCTPPITVAMHDAWTFLWFDRARPRLRAALTQQRQNEDQREENQQRATPGHAAERGAPAPYGHANP
jgi:DNA repair protein RadD